MCVCVCVCVCVFIFGFLPPFVCLFLFVCIFNFKYILLSSYLYADVNFDKTALTVMFNKLTWYAMLILVLTAFYIP